MAFKDSQDFTSITDGSPMQIALDNMREANRLDEIFADLQRISPKSEPPSGAFSTMLARASTSSGDPRKKNPYWYYYDVNYNAYPPRAMPPIEEQNRNLEQFYKNIPHSEWKIRDIGWIDEDFRKRKRRYFTG